MPTASPDPFPLAPAILRAFRELLPAWYDTHQRDLPWRHTRDPYAIVVSEYMLQQTQVATVIPYFLKWMERYPDWSTLARAPEATVLKSWEGLGYYRRARYLHQLSKHVSTNLQGRLPQTAPELRLLPGIGPYMAGAVASIAFGQRTPLVDGNVERVFCRVFACAEPVDATPTKKRMWALAENLLPDTACGDYNQALMELGATICTPRNPPCLLCPLQSVCRADDPHRYPQKKPSQIKRSKRKYTVVLRGEKIWLLDPATPGLWNGLPRLPEWDAAWMRPGRTCGRMVVGITTHRIEATVFLTTASTNASIPTTGKWTDLSTLARITLPAPHRRMIDMALKSRM